MTKIKFTPPTPEQIREWQKSAGLSDAVCAEYAGLSGGQNWRRYKSTGSSRRNIPSAVWFSAVAHTVLSDDQIAEIKAAMHLGT